MNTTNSISLGPITSLGYHLGKPIYHGSGPCTGKSACYMVTQVSYYSGIVHSRESPRRSGPFDEHWYQFKITSTLGEPSSMSLVSYLLLLPGTFQDLNGSIHLYKSSQKACPCRKRHCYALRQPKSCVQHDTPSPHERRFNPHAMSYIQVAWSKVGSSVLC